MADAGFAPVAFRKGTIFGFSPRMRYDLVVNAFVKDALATGRLNVFMGGEMWRPLIDVEDVARAYVIALDADAGQVGGQVFNLSAGNFRIAELALRTQRALRGRGRRGGRQRRLREPAGAQLPHQRDEGRARARVLAAGVASRSRSPAWSARSGRAA